MTESNVQVSRAHVDGVPSQASIVQGGQLDDPFAERVRLGIVPGMAPGRNMTEEILAPYKVRAHQDAKQQGELVDSFIHRVEGFSD